MLKYGVEAGEPFNFKLGNCPVCVNIDSIRLFMEVIIKKRLESKSLDLDLKIVLKLARFKDSFESS